MTTSTSSSASSTLLTLPHFDDFHLHLRDGNVLKDMVPTVAQTVRYAIIMPNLQPPVVTTQDATNYYERIMAIAKSSMSTSATTSNFHPLMTLYLTHETTAEEIRKARESGLVYAVKLYPAHATTHSAFGIDVHNQERLEALAPTFHEMSNQQMPLLIHGEVTDANVDVFDREKEFITHILPYFVKNFPKLPIVLEHITTKDAVDFINSLPEDARIAATITAHHLLYNRNELFRGGLNVYNYCLPVLKAEEHRKAVLEAATSGNPRFFAGTDSAPHAQHKKLHEGCAGCYTANAAIELYAQAFDSVGKLDKLEAFVSKFGAQFYKLPSPTTTSPSSQIQLIKEDWVMPAELPFGDDKVIPFMANKTVHFRSTRIE